MLAKLRQLRALLRVEIRAWWRAPLRAALVIVLIAVPIATVVGASLVLRSILQTPEARAAQVVGAADLRAEARGVAAAKLVAGLPEGAVSEPLVRRLEHVVVAGLRLAAVRYSLRRGGLAAPVLHVLAGRLPRSKDEVTLSPILLEATGLSVGEEVRLESAAESVRIVGVAVEPGAVRAPLLVDGYDPDAVRGATSVFAQMPATVPVGPVAGALRHLGAPVSVGDELRSARAGVEEAALLLGSVGLFEAALVIAAAFAIGLRRRQREVGLLAVGGAEPRSIVGAILASSVGLAVIGWVVGAAAGIGGAIVLQPYFVAWSGRVAAEVAISWETLGAALVLGVATAVLAAVWPARSAARLPVRIALSGRRPAPGGSRGWLALGLCLVVVGGMLTLTASAAANETVNETVGLAGVLLGAVLSVGGCGACTPFLLERLSRVAGHLPVAWRLAVRDAGRFRTRNAPVVTAVLAGMALSVTIAAIATSLGGDPAAARAVLLPSLMRIDGPAASSVAAEIAAGVPGAQSAAAHAVTLDGEPVEVRLDGRVGWAATGSPDLAHLLGASPRVSQQESQPLEVLAPNGRVLATVPASAFRVVPDLRQPMVWIAPAELPSRGLAMGAPPRLGNSGVSAASFVRLPHAVDAAAVRAARAAAARVPGTTVDAALLHGREPEYLFRAVFLLSLLTGVLVIGIATALTAVESRRDREVLVAIGAAPGLQRSHVAAQAGFLALLGCVLAIPAGMLPASGIVDFLGGGEIGVPWGALLLTTLGLPVLTYAGAWLLVGTAARPYPLPGTLARVVVDS